MEPMFSKICVAALGISIIASLVIWKFTETNMSLIQLIILYTSAWFMGCAMGYGISDPGNIESYYCTFATIALLLLSIFGQISTFGFTIKITPSNKKNITIQQ